MFTIRQILEEKGYHTWSVAPHEISFKALELMAEKDVGALLVIDEHGEFKGIFSERDYARKVILKGKSSKETTVHELMSQDIVCISPDKHIHECMALMVEMDIRHIPVFENKKLIGIVSMRDVVKAGLAEQEITISDLQDYVCGRGYGHIY